MCNAIETIYQWIKEETPYSHLARLTRSSYADAPNVIYLYTTPNISILLRTSTQSNPDDIIIILYYELGQLEDPVEHHLDIHDPDFFNKLREIIDNR